MIKDIERVIHIIETIDKINEFVATKPKDEVLETAILHKIQIIGEAANHVSQEMWGCKVTV